MVLQVGQFVDVRSSFDNKWYPVQVTNIFENGNVRVHYLGWTKSSDETVAKNKIDAQVAPLFSNSEDRRKWKVGDSVDYLSLDLGEWVQVPIKAVNRTNDTVAVQLDQSEMDLAMLIEEDSVEWMEICSEYIAPLHTFTRRRNKRTSNQANTTSTATATVRAVTPTKTTKSSSSHTASSSHYLVNGNAMEIVDLTGEHSNSSTSSVSAPASLPKHALVPLPSTHVSVPVASRNQVSMSVPVTPPRAAVPLPLPLPVHAVSAHIPLMCSLARTSTLSTARYTTPVILTHPTINCSLPQLSTQSAARDTTHSTLPTIQHTNTAHTAAPTVTLPVTLNIAVPTTRTSYLVPRSRASRLSGSSRASSAASRTRSSDSGSANSINSYAVSTIDDARSNTSGISNAYGAVSCNTSGSTSGASTANVPSAVPAVTHVPPLPPLPPQLTHTSWLYPLLHTRQVSAQHIQLCEQALISDEGFTDATLFASLSMGQGDMIVYLNSIGITPKGVQMKLAELHKTLQGSVR